MPRKRTKAPSFPTTDTTIPALDKRNDTTESYNVNNSITKSSSMTQQEQQPKNDKMAHKHAKQINHPTSFMPMFDYESMFSNHTAISGTKNTSSSCFTETEGEKEQKAIQTQAIRNLESDPTLLHIFHERSSVGSSSVTKSKLVSSSSTALFDVGSSSNKFVSNWIPIKRHAFYHSKFYQDVLVENPTLSTLECKQPLSCSIPILKEGVFPVHSACTCMTSISIPSSSSTTVLEYVAIGDSAGYVTIYTVSPFLLAIHRLETSASHREFQEDEEYYKDQIQKKQQRMVGNNTTTTTKRAGVVYSKDESNVHLLLRNFDTKSSISSQCCNSIETLCFTCSASHLIVGTKIEIEYIDCRTNTIIWTIPLSNMPAYNLSGYNYGIIATSALSTPSWNTKHKMMTIGSITRLDAHPTLDHGGILASITFGHKDKDQEVSSSREEKENSSSSPSSAFASISSPCLLIRHIPSSMEVQDKAQSNDVAFLIPKPIPKDDTSLYIGPCALAIWDRSNNSRILGSFLTWEGIWDPTMSDESMNFKHELILIDHDSQYIQYRSELPSKVNGPKLTIGMAINQTENGTYSIITSTKIGIRLYATEGLEALATYGEGISIHNYIINWQDCFFMKWGKEDGGSAESFRMDSIKQWRRGSARQREDEVAYRKKYNNSVDFGNNQEKTDSLKNLYIVGIPCAFKEPLEITDTIHFWDLSTFDYIGGQKLPSYTLKIPGKSASITSTIYCADRHDIENGKLLLMSQNGDLFQLSSSTVSDWAGAMYDPGYQLVDGNIIYVEDEDALDNVVDTSYTTTDAALGMTESRARTDRNQIFLSELELALKLSIDEQKFVISDHENVDFDILGTDGTMSRPFICNPEPYLQGVASSISLESSKNKSTAATNGTTSFALSFFPQMNEALIYMENEKTKIYKKMTSLAESSDASISCIQPRKRSKPNSSGGALMESINHSLLKALIVRESFANGSGSLPSGKKHSSCVTTEAIGEFCSACDGRLVRHVCGRRNLPMDLSVIDKDPKRFKGKKQIDQLKRNKPNTNKILPSLTSDSIILLRDNDIQILENSISEERNGLYGLDTGNLQNTGNLKITS